MLEQPHEPVATHHQEPAAVADVIDLSTQEDHPGPLEQQPEQLGSFEAAEPSAPVQLNLAPDYHPRNIEPSRVIYSLPTARTRSPAPSVDSWSTSSQRDYRPRSSASTSQAGMHYVDYDQTSSLIGGSLLHKPGGAPRREPTPASSWAAEAYRTTYADNFRWLQKENTGEAPSNRHEPAEAHPPRYGKRRRVLSGADAWAVAQQSARELFPPPAAPVAEYQVRPDSRARATVERGVQTEISAVSPRVLVPSQNDVQRSAASPQQEKRHFRPGQSYESSNASVRSQAPQSAQPPQQQKRHFRQGENYEANSVAAPTPLGSPQLQRRHFRSGESYESNSVAAPASSQQQQKRHFRSGESCESNGVAAPAPSYNARVSANRFATPSKRPTPRKQRSSTPLGASRLMDNPILANQRFPPQPLTFSAQSTYEKEFKWLPRRR